MVITKKEADIDVEKVKKEIVAKKMQLQTLYTSVFALTGMAWEGLREVITDNIDVDSFPKRYIPGMATLFVAAGQFITTQDTLNGNNDKISKPRKVASAAASGITAGVAGAAALAGEAIVLTGLAVAEAVKAIVSFPKIIKRFFANRKLKKEIIELKRSIGEKIETRKEKRARIKAEKNTYYKPTKTNFRTSNTQGTYYASPYGLKFEEPTNSSITLNNQLPNTQINAPA